MPSAMTLTRYFGGLVRSQVEHLSEVLGKFVSWRLPRPPLGATLDLDSTVFRALWPSREESQGLQSAQAWPYLTSSAAGDSG